MSRAVARVHGRTRRRRTALRERGWFKALEMIAVVAVLGAAGYGLYIAAQQADNFAVRQIEVYGLERLDEYAIAEASGITDASNLLFMSTELAAHQIESLAGVAQCTVSRVFPDTVRIDIVERVPYATVLVANSAFLIDAGGVVLRELEPYEPPVGPFISSLPDVHMLAVGNTIDSRPLQDSLAVLRAFSATALAEHVTISEIAARHENDIRLYSKELTYEVRWGRGDFENAARRLEGLWLARGKVIGCEEYLDLRFGADLACK